VTILGTIPGQRLFRPAFGSNLYNLLFEPMNNDTASSIRNTVILAIERWETRVVLKNSSVTPDYSNLAYHVSLQYIIPTLMNKSATFAFDLSKLPN
jgi:phage baseplate assembly protein W